MDGRLELVSSKGAEKQELPEVIPLSNEAIILGRSRKSVNVVLDLPNNTISRRHAEIVRTAGRGIGSTAYAIRDLNSTNGIFVNNIRVLESNLQNGDIVQFGGAAGVPVGTVFAGDFCHIRYRFVEVAAVPLPASRKRRNPDSASKDPPKVSPAQRKINPAQRSSSPAHSGPRKASGQIPPSNPAVVTQESDAKRDLARSDTTDAVETLRSMSNNSICVLNNGSGARKGRGKNPASNTVKDVLGDAMCGLCSEVLLDAAVLPCSHCFCRLCWIEHAQKGDSKCPVCLRKFHSSERGRRCSNLDLVITSLIQKLAGVETRERWAKRQQDAKAREEQLTAKHAAGNVGLGMTSNSWSPSLFKNGRSPNLATPRSHDTPSGRGVHITADANGLNPVETCIFERSANGGVTSRQNARGTSGGRSGEDASSSQRQEKTVLMCEGCNEEGHEFRQCPHRSDSAVENSNEESEEDDDGEDEEYEDE